MADEDRTDEQELGVDLGFSEDQLRYIDATTTLASQRGARAALKHYVRRTLVAWVIGFVAIAGIYFDNSSSDRSARSNIVHSGDAVAVSGCNRDFGTIFTTRQQLEASILRFDALVKDGTYTQQQADAGKKYTEAFLVEYLLPDCRKADDVLTQDAAPQIPTPRYPGDPQSVKDSIVPAQKAGPEGQKPEQRLDNQP